MTTQYSKSYEAMPKAELKKILKSNQIPFKGWKALTLDNYFGEISLKITTEVSKELETVKEYRNSNCDVLMTARPLLRTTTLFLADKRGGIKEIEPYRTDEKGRGVRDHVTLLSGFLGLKFKECLYVVSHTYPMRLSAAGKPFFGTGEVHITVIMQNSNITNDKLVD